MSDFLARFEEIRKREQLLSDSERIELMRRFDAALAIADMAHTRYRKYVEQEEKLKKFRKLERRTNPFFIVLALSWFSMSGSTHAYAEQLASFAQMGFYISLAYICFSKFEQTLLENTLTAIGEKILDIRCEWNSVATCYSYDAYMDQKFDAYPMKNSPVDMNDRIQSYSLDLRSTLIDEISRPLG
jgi:hypothetical protein